jgi:hypothetical protein
LQKVLTNDSIQNRSPLHGTEHVLPSRVLLDIISIAAVSLPPLVLLSSSLPKARKINVSVLVGDRKSRARSTVGVDELVLDVVGEAEQLAGREGTKLSELNESEC